MLRVPRFALSQINPRIAVEEIGTLFQQFVWEVYLAQYTDLLSFAGLGRDGGIDLSHTQGHVRTVLECKAIGEDGYRRPQREWRKVARHLQENLQNPAGPPPGQPQYTPWYQREVPIREYIFCSSNKLGSQDKLDRLRGEICGFFRQLAAMHAHLAHLRDLEVTVLDWTHFETRLRQNGPLAFRWFPRSVLAGFSLLDDFRPDSGFRSYLSSDRLPYYSRSAYLASRPAADLVSVVREEDLLNALDRGDCTGIILTGVGGAGKTRMTLELGRLARKRGWVAVRGKSRLQAEDLDALVQNAGQTPILFLLDYVETRRDFPEFVERLNDLREDLGCRLAYIANCRNTYYPAIETTPKHRCVSVSSKPAVGELDPYLREVVHHILRSAGLEATREEVAVCGNLPILAVFLSYLHSQGRQEDLRTLLDEQDFGSWINRRIMLSFPGRDPLALAHDLALLMALFPMSERCYQRGYEAEIFGDLLRRLARDGWIDRARADAAGEARWVILHDVFADRILLRFLESPSFTAEPFVKELFRIARDFGSLRSAFTSLQRLAGRSEIDSVRWRHLLEAEIVDDPSGWRSVRDLLPATSLLGPHDRIALLSLPEDFWRGAEGQTEFHNSLGSLARWLLSEEARPHVQLLRPILTPWLVRASQCSSATSIVLTRALEFCPDQVESHALARINSKPRLFQTHYLLVAWLNAALDPQKVQEAVFAWVSCYASAPRAQFVYRAWLDATKEAAPIRDKLLAWVEQHGGTPEASFIYQAWLNATKEAEPIRDKLLAWVEQHGGTPEASFVYRSWLDATKEVEPIRDKLLAWVDQHGGTLEARFVYQAWLDATQDIRVIRYSLGRWLSLHHACEDVDFLCHSWLEAGGDFGLVRVAALAWVAQHGDEESAVYLFKYITRLTELPADVVLAALRWCQRYPNNADAVWRLAALKRHLFLEQVAEDFVAAAERVLEVLLQQTPWEALTGQVALQVLSFLITANSLETAARRSRVDTVFISMLRHPQILGSGVFAHPTIQRVKCFARFVELIQFGRLDQPGDDQAIARFLDWVDGWGPDRKNELRDLHKRLLNQFAERAHLWNRLKND